jgi:2',3'-cyclic-nucleotide 2'-phosphodiesterase (5'-nucleotidase family)
MKLSKIILIALFTIFLLSACITPTPEATPGDTPETPKETDHKLTILYTDDEHGWMEGEEVGSGAANLVGLWRSEHGYGTGEAVLILSGGDNWTGPAISTWFEGESMVEVMNAMGYAASTIGNHEFDFGLQTMSDRLGEVNFPYLSANMRYEHDHTIPRELGIEPYTVLDLNGLKVGIVGLSTTSTPYTTHPAYVAGFEFIDYEDALREFVPQAKAEGAEIILVIAHVCPDELVVLANDAKDLAIPFMGGGHCHDQFSTQVGNTVIATSGANFSGYAYTRLKYDPNSGGTTIIEYGTRPNTGGHEDEFITEIITPWQQRTDDELNREIGYLSNQILRQSQEMQDLTTESWLIGYPTGDIAFTNLGGMRDNLGSGVITIVDIISVMPFDNILVEVKLTGAQILDVQSFGSKPLAVGGMQNRGGQWTLDDTGEQLDMEKTYSVLVSDYLYAGGDNFTMFADYDPDAYFTGIDWRQPVIDWIEAQDSSPENPLDQGISALGD